MVASAPSARTRASFSSDEEVAMTRAPAALAMASASSDTPPVPNMSTVRPGPTGLGPRISAFQAVTPAQGNVAASSNDRLSASGTTPYSGRTTYSLSMPGADGAPSAGPGLALGGPATQPWKNVPATRS